MFSSNSIVTFYFTLWTDLYTYLQAVPETGSSLGLSFRTSITQNEIPLLGTFV